MGARAKLGLAAEKIFSAGQGCDTRHKAIKAKLTVDFARKKGVLARGQNTMEVWITELNSGVGIRAKWSSGELNWLRYLAGVGYICSLKTGSLIDAIYLETCLRRGSSHTREC
jgi:hypothetical protein